MIQSLLDAPHSFDLVQAVRALEGVQAFQSKAEGEPQDATPLDEDGHVDLHAVRFVSDTSLRYPGSAITRVKETPQGSLELTISLIGLLGPLGVLPYSYTKHVVASTHNNDEALRNFIDIFHHRAVTLFCNASSKYRIALSRKHKDSLTGEEANSFTVTLKALSGIFTPGMSDRLAISDETIIHHAGLFSAQTRSLAALEALLTSELGQEVRVVPFVGGWVSVPPLEQTRLGGADEESGLHARLDASAMVGDRCWMAQDHFRLVIGPVSEDQLISLLPGQPRAILIADLVQMFCGLEFTFDVNLIVKARQVPAARLARHEDDLYGARLGQMAWILSADSPVDRSDAVFSIGSLG
ncbi:type VI secretion system baseplate subunit TssG [Aquabacter sp. CN5-332]|uniref:type VI secretion system baseplate subunit TssG n=1 Tax=Aquabacter sp. CN5-332 TaxID=3156608 RepID=UPI0032B60864